MADDDKSLEPDTDPAGGDNGFADAFAERSAGGEKPDSEPGDDSQPGPDSDEGAASAPSDDQAGEPSAQEEKPASQGDTFDPFAGLTPQQVEHFRKLEQSERSQRGRVGALTKSLNQYRAAPAQPKPQEQQQDQGDESAKDLEKRLAQAAEDYPDAVGPLKELVEQMGKKIADLSQQVEPISERQSQSELQEAYSLLAEKHPDFADIAQDAKFSTWIAEQTPGVQGMANSFNPDEVSLVLTLYKSEAGIEQQPVSTGRTETDAKRGRQLDATRDVPSSGAPAASGTPNDFDAAFRDRARRYAKS